MLWFRRMNEGYCVYIEPVVQSSLAYGWSSVSSVITELETTMIYIIF